MKFRSIPGFEGMVYDPSCAEECKKKHACLDCFGCQQCSDDRCARCREEKKRKKKKKSGRYR